MAGISYDSVEVLQNFATRKKIEIPLLSDPDSAVIRSFGLLNESVPRNSPFFGVPHPLTYIVDASGVIASVYFEADYTKRFTTGLILSEEAAASKSEPTGNARVSIRTSASDTVVRGGERVRLFVDLSLGKKIHVYAPGVTGYIPLTWTITGSEALNVQFPKARMLHLAAIDETVPVYEGNARLTADISVPQSKDLEKGAGRFTIQGTLRYQACDDRQCFLPEEVPVGWTFRYEPPDATRVPAELRRK